MEEVRWIYCNLCQRETKHKPVSEYSNNNSKEIDEYLTLWWTHTCYLWECGGCNALVAELKTQFSEDFYAESEYYPVREVSTLKKKQYKEISDKIEALYNEVIDSFNNSSYILCSIGLRALLEGILKDRGIDGSNLKVKIDAAEFIPSNIRNNLNGFRFLGNNSAHELFRPEKVDLEAAIYVIEDILNIVYDLDYRSKILYDKFNN